MYINICVGGEASDVDLISISAAATTQITGEGRAKLLSFTYLLGFV